MTALARRATRRGALLVAVAWVAAMAGLVSAPAVREVAAATPDLTIVTAARYDVRPADHLVHVTVEATAVNHRSDTATRRFYFDSATMPVLPGTRAFRATASGPNPKVSVDKSTKDYRLLRIAFGRRVFSHQTFRFRLSFDLPDRGGAANRDVRIGQSVASFPVWAFATASTPGSRVSVAFPAGYTIHVDQGSLSAPKRSGKSLVLRAGPIADAGKFFAFVSAERPGAYANVAATTTVAGQSVKLAIRPWTDDAAWGRLVRSLFVRGLPVLGELIGVPYPRTDTLTVQEAVTRATGGYAGLFDPASGRIEVAYYAAPFVVLHEATHAWFNGALLVDRWANEGFASYYAQLAAGRLKTPVTAPRLTPDLAAAKVPLNAWGAVGRGDTKTESYGYAAALELARQVAARAGQAGLAKVWAAAAAHEAADQPVHATGATGPETIGGPPDWRGLLDLLEARTGQRFDDLWRTWVVRPDEAALLDRRASVREDYQATVRAAGDWEVPAAVRNAVDAWQFDQASALIAQARDVLGRRDGLERDAAAAKLTLPGSLKREFEGEAGFRGAIAEAEAETAAIKTIVAADAARPAQPDPITQLGLVTATPDEALGNARSAFADGRLNDAVASAEAARSAWTSAPEVGRTLLIRLVLGGVAIVLLLLLAVRALRRRSTTAQTPGTPGTPETPADRPSSAT